MREIKFRAWDRRNKKMTKHFGYGKGYMVGDEGISLNELIEAQKSRLDIMQYIGLKDKNGVEIYEGDIISEGDGKAQVIQWDGDCARFFYATKTASVGLYGFYGKVIGNIYEHPELLQKGQNHG